MIRREARTNTCLILVMALAIFPVTSAEQQQEQEHLSRGQLQLLVKNAASAKDFQRLATYYHYQELLYRKKAQSTLDEYANVNSRYSMATKTVSRAEVASREYQGCLKKASESAGRAAHYDAILTEMGVTPQVISAITVSAKPSSAASAKSDASFEPSVSPTLLNKTSPTRN